MKKLLTLIIIVLATLLSLGACAGEEIDVDSISFESAEFEYDGTEKSIEATNVPEGVTVTYEGNGVKEVGTYTVTAYFEYVEETDKEIEPLYATITIVKATYNPEFEGLDVNYDGKIHSVSIKGELPDGVNVFFENNSHKLPGSYKVEVSFTYDKKHYNEIKSRSVTLKIAPGEYSLPSLTYGTRADGTYQITGYKGTAPDVIIPERINGIYVRSIASDAFRGNTSVQYVYLPDTVNNIGNSAFRGSTLADIRLSDNLEVIGASAFEGTKVTEITLPDRLTSLGYGAFADTSLEYIKLPFIGGSHTSTNDYIGYIFGATEYFANTTAVPGTLTEIELSDRCQKIPAYAFYGCISLRKLTLGSSVKSIGNNAFAECLALKSLYIPASVTDIYANANTYDSPFYRCSADLKIVFARSNAEGFGQYFSHISDTTRATVIFDKTYEQYLEIAQN